MVFSLFHNFIRPIDDTAEFLYIGVTEFHKFFGGDFASSATTTVYENQSIFVGKFFFGSVFDFIFGNQNRIFNMSFGEFFFGTGVYDNIIRLGIHNCFGFFCRNLIVGWCVTAILTSSQTEQRKRYYKH